MPILIKHGEDSIRQILEKTVTLEVGKRRSFHFIDKKGDKVACYINRVELVDMWKQAEERFRDLRDQQILQPEQLEEMQRSFYSTLENSCPKGMCYMNVEYECTKNMRLQFYSKEYLRSCPEMCGEDSLMIISKPEQKTGAHQLPLKGCMIQTVVSPDISKIPAEAFFAFESVEAWKEIIL